ncbi:MAG: hypothetical protein U1D00_28980, partial [Mycobacterium sp.]|nr:hypothetical protein [Mycobacterium sp.]
MIGMFRPRIVSLCAAFLAASPVLLPPAAAQLVAESGVVLPPYAQIADRVVGAPAILDVRIRSATRIKGPEAANVAAGHQRFYVEADVLALIRADAPLPTRVGYVVDVPLDARGRAPKL